LSDQTQQKTSRQINEQRPIGESAAHSNLHHTLQSITRKRADGPEQRNQEYFQASTPSRKTFFKSGQTKNSWCLAATRSHQRKSDPIQDAAFGGYGELHRLSEFRIECIAGLSRAQSRNAGFRSATVKNESGSEFLR
jgi:hypothetical protein